jgi:hypothetical protein
MSEILNNFSVLCFSSIISLYNYHVIKNLKYDPESTHKQLRIFTKSYRIIKIDYFSELTYS